MGTSNNNPSAKYITRNSLKRKTIAHFHAEKPETNKANPDNKEAKFADFKTKMILY